MKMERVTPCWHRTFRNKRAAERRVQRRGMRNFESLEQRVMLSSVVPGGESALLTTAQAADASGSDLSVSQTSDTTNVTQGGFARYTVTVENVGSADVIAAQVEDRLLHFMSDVSWTATTTGGATANLSGQGDIHESVDLPIGSSIVYLIEGTIRKDHAGFISNVATVNVSSGTDIDPSDNRASINQVVNQFSEPNGVELVAGEQILGPENGIDVELGDLDGDGDLDAIFVNGPRPDEDSDIDTFAEVWFHVGSGKFIKQYEIQMDATEVPLGDLDADGDLDLFFANAKDYDAACQAIWINDGTGHFTQSDQPFLNLHNSDVQLGDLDGDGDLDAMILGRRYKGWSKQNEVRVWLNDGSGGFDFQHHLLLGRKHFDDGDISLGDIDGDGDLDAFVTGGSGSGEDREGAWTLNWVLENDGTGTFSKLDSYHPPVRFFSSDAIEMKDLNHDGILDAVLYEAGDWFAAVYLGNGDGTFTHHHQFSSVGRPADILVEDFNGDGHQDVAFSGEVNASIYLGNGRGQFQNRRTAFARSYNSFPDSYYANGAVGDIDGDGDLDIVGPRGPVMFNGTSQNQYSENFESDPLTQFTLSHPDSFSAVNYGDSQRLQVDGTTPKGLRTALLNADYALPSPFEMSTVVTAIPGPDHWHTGFLIFDYVNKSNFKYAGMLAGQHQWVIGHYQGDFSNRTVQVDWDDVGRTIDPNRNYKLHVHLAGNEVYLTVNGDFIAQAAFAHPITSGKVGLASYGGVSLFDNFQIDRYLSDGTNYDVPFHEDFENDIANKMLFNSPARWDFVDNGPGNKSLAFNGTNFPSFGTAVLEESFRFPYDNDDYVNDLSVVMKPLTKEGTAAGGYLIYDYVNEDRFKYIHISVDENTASFGAYRNGEFFPDPYYDFSLSVNGIELEAGQSYLLHVNFALNHISLSIDGVRIAFKYGYFDQADNPQLGFGAYNSVTLFDDFQVGNNLSKGGLELPLVIDFEDGQTDPFHDLTEPASAVIDHDAGKVLRINHKQVRYSHSPILGIAYPQLPLDRAYQLSVDVRSNPLADGWQNGFLIFDYQNAYDFKYAGFFAGQNEWIIGHYSAKWNYRLAEVDWNDQGRDIETRRWYSMNVAIDGSQVTLIVDGETIATADFFSPIHSGGVGIGVDQAFTWFDNFSVTESTNAIETSDPVFAKWEDEADDLLI